MIKFLTPFTEPIGVIWSVLVLVTIWRLWKRRFRSALGPGVCAAVFYAIGGTKLPAHLLAQLERDYARNNWTNMQPVDAIVMLGGILRISSNDPLGFDLNESADRLMAAVELVRAGKGRVLVLGGGAHGPKGNEKCESELLRQLLLNWGLTNQPVYVLGKCGNTRDEAEHTQALARQHGWRRICLVTSASHMKRAEAVFRNLGFDVTCVACDFEGLASFEQGPRRSIAPGIEGFRLLSLYSHEVVGWWLYKARGWVN